MPPSSTLATAFAAPPRRKLPIGIQTFSEIIGEGHYYVDKSGFAIRLANEGKYYFLSRPRRFGKSLFLDTLREMFEGNQALFKGLVAETGWDWSQTYPVIRISLGDGVLKTRTELNQRIGEILLDNQRRLGVVCTHQSLGGQLSELIAQAHQKTGQRAVVLIDEYDKPILDNIEHSAAALEMREGLKNLYSVLKGSDEHLKFVFLTGVSKFSKVSLFSGLNNLTDITLDERYSAICGYTDADVDSVFAPELPGLDREQIRQWYNGYNWLGTPVYNPFGLLQLFRTRQIRPHWFETGTPTFLIKLLQQRQQFTPDLSRIVASEALLSTFDVDNIPVEALMFQAGYLTIAEVWQVPGQMELTLKYPNLEVQSALNNSLLQSLTGSLAGPGQHLSKLYKLLAKPDFAGLKALFHAFYASIANDWYRKNELSHFEGYYASIFYSYFAALGLDIQLEEATNVGRIDMTVLFNGQVFLFEFKVVELNPAGKALQQIKDMRYFEKFMSRGEPVHLIGVEFSKASRNIVGFEVETLQIS
ncbi:ATP-binding protein [Rhodoferax sp.]|uniref:ATP-binding protein n=1 Tax=Rhodoferax sp. TaxID=50421 RepID=UPI00261E80AF|nr:ATP-binding protein [Rhodoferax sp.]MDD2810416.1 AAA family ATPase [Rhodoferax sp.]MDD4943067.1 AAA family ATPase [Rhodoferax sp.]MDD5479403.1 AAA family ATPase [Rhodoferax sp.]